MRKTYPSNVTDQQWDIIEVLIPVNRLGRPREVSMREVVNTIFYLNRSGCQWDMLPHDLLPKSTVYDLLQRRQRIKEEAQALPQSSIVIETVNADNAPLAEEEPAGDVIL